MEQTSLNKFYGILISLMDTGSDDTELCPRCLELTNNEL